MSTASRNREPESSYEQLMRQTLQAFDIARASVQAVVEAIATGSPDAYDRVKEKEEQLDTLDREVNEGVTAAITQVTETEGRELLACLKLVIELERISDLMLGFGNRLRAVAPRLEEHDRRDLNVMAALVRQMLTDGFQAYRERDLDRAVAVLRADSELDRLRNLIFVRHIENPEGLPRQESFHLVFMSQALERAGDHSKNVAEEVCQLVSGRSIRHLLRTYDKPWENMFVDFMRRREIKRETKP